jgi:hypothetical protein
MEPSRRGSMRRILAASGLLLALAIPAVSIANPPRDNANGPHKDYISGTANVPLPTPLGTFPAIVSQNGTTEPNGHSGDQATGTWTTDFLGTPLGDIHLAGNILCINAIRGAENGADWRGVVTSSNTPLAPVGLGILSRTVDPPGGAGDSDLPDRNIGFLTAPPGPHPTCPSVILATNQITGGDLTVHDGGF